MTWGVEFPLGDPQVSCRDAAELATLIEDEVEIL
jgi:hypothetical protein